MGLASGSNAAAPVQQVVAADGQPSDVQRGIMVATIRECLDELQDTFIPVNELQVGGCTGLRVLKWGGGTLMVTIRECRLEELQVGA